MTDIQLILTTAINSMVHYLMRDYQVTYSWAMRTVLASDTYQHLIESFSFRNESTLYVYQFLIRELQRKQILIPQKEGE